MAIKKVKVRKLNVPRIIVILLVIYILGYLCYYIYSSPVHHYEITGNTHVSDADILRVADLKDYPSFITLDSAYFMPFGNHLSTTEKGDWPASWVDVKKVIFKRLDKVYPNWQNYTKSNEENNVTSKTFTIYRSKRFRIAINCRRVDMYSVCKLPPSLHNFRFSIDKITIFCAM